MMGMAATSPTRKRHPEVGYEALHGSVKMRNERGATVLGGLLEELQDLLGGRRTKAPVVTTSAAPATTRRKRKLLEVLQDGHVLGADGASWGSLGGCWVAVLITGPRAGYSSAGAEGFAGSAAFVLRALGGALQGLAGGAQVRRSIALAPRPAGV